jgi:hypothetical protein
MKTKKKARKGFADMFLHRLQALMYLFATSLKIALGEKINMGGDKKKECSRLLACSRVSPLACTRLRFVQLANAEVRTSMYNYSLYLCPSLSLPAQEKLVCAKRRHPYV